MKNRDIVHARQEVKIYREYYQPSLNLWRFTKSIIGVLFFGSSTVATYSTTKKKSKQIKNRLTAVFLFILKLIF